MPHRAEWWRGRRRARQLPLHQLTLVPLPTSSACREEPHLSVLRNASKLTRIDLVDRARLELRQRERAVGGADQARDLQAEVREDAADLAVLALGQAHLDPAVAAGAPLEVGVDRAVADALDGDSFGERFELGLRHGAEGAGAVGADDPGARQLELALQFAVVGEQQQPFGHEVEAADRHQPRQALGQPVVDGRRGPWGRGPR